MNKIQKIAGVLSSQEILELINKDLITSGNGIEKDLIQPASIDLRLGVKAWSCLLYTSPSPRDPL